MSKRPRLILLVVTVLILAGCAIAYYWRRFPYGHSHCCIIGMSFALEQFAEENGGKYPAGEACAEAALSLLYRSNYIDAYTLRGITVPEKTVRAILDRGDMGLA